MKNDAWRLAFINNANACLLFIPFVLYYEGSAIMKVSFSILVSNESLMLCKASSCNVPTFVYHEMRSVQRYEL